MIQCLEMKFSIEPKKREFNDVIEETYQFMLLLKEAGLGVEPNYETVWKKRDAKLFDWSYENFSNMMKKELKPDEEELGVSIGFFSSLDDDESGGILVAIGSSDKRINDMVQISFPNTTAFDKETAQKIEVLFRKSIELLHPFYGVIRNTKNFERYLDSERGRFPFTVHWLKYYASPELVDILGKADGKYNFYQKEKFQDGYYFKIQELPIDDDNEEDIKRQMEINRILGIQ